MLSRYTELPPAGKQGIKSAWMQDGGTVCKTRSKANQPRNMLGNAYQQTRYILPSCDRCFGVGGMRIRSLCVVRSGISVASGMEVVEFGGSATGRPACGRSVRESVPAGCRRFCQFGTLHSNRADETPLPMPVRLRAAWTLLSDPFRIAEKPQSSTPSHCCHAARISDF